MTNRLLLLALMTAAVPACSSLLADEVPPASQPASSPSALKVEYVYSPTCVKCREARNTVDAVEKKYGDRIQVLRHNVLEEEGFTAAEACEKRLGLDKPTVPPTVFVGRRFLTGLDDIAQHLDAAVAEELALGQAPPVAPAEAAQGAGENRWLQKLTLGGVVAGGLVDGINPCAFTTIIFFLSMLAYLKRSRREMIVVSVSFIAAMFVTYLLVGAGLLLAVKALSVEKGISRWLTYAVAALTFAFAGWSLFDAVRFGLGVSKPKMALGMPNSIKQRVHKVIREGLKTRRLVMGAITVGFLVTLLEGVCTGQVYGPIILMLKTQYWPQALAYLVLYNLLFVLPLIILTLLTLWGVSSERLGKFLGQRVWLAKLGLAILFTGLGVILLVTA